MDVVGDGAGMWTELSDQVKVATGCEGLPATGLPTSLLLLLCGGGSGCGALGQPHEGEGEAQRPLPSFFPSFTSFLPSFFTYTYSIQNSLSLSVP